MSRIEHKYLVRTDRLLHLRKALDPYLRFDHYAARNPSGEYTVRSIYFDTRNLDFYHEKIDGLRVRKKVRVRGYDDFLKNAMVFLEIKKKKDSFILKHRSPVEFQSLKPLLASGDVQKYVYPSNGYSYAPENAKRFLFQIHHRALRPYILILYEREAYYSKFHHDLRITFDKNIRSLSCVPLDSLYRQDGFVFTMPGYFILEIKSVIQYPYWLNQIISHFELKQQSLSKYTMCIDSHTKGDQLLPIVTNSHFHLRV